MRRLKSLSQKLVLGFVAVNFAGLLSESTAYAQNSFGILSGLSLPSYRYDDYDIERQQERVDRAQREVDSERRDVEESNRNLGRARSREQEINQELQNISRQLDANNRQVAELARAVSDNESMVERKRNEAATLAADIKRLEDKGLPLYNEIEELKKRRDQSTNEAEKQELQRQIDAKNAVFQPMYEEWQAKKKTLEQVNAQLQQASNNLTQARSQLSSAQAETPRLQARQNEVRRNFEGASRERQQREREQEVAERELQSRNRDLQQEIRNLDQIRNNINIASNILRSEGSQQGGNDGSREGLEIGRDRGQRDGDTEGLRDGDARGTRDGQDRDFASGRAEGRNQATQDAIRKATADGQVKGQADGLRNGQADGLKAAYDLGMNEGLSHGAQTGDDKEAYNQGRGEGERSGLARAVEDARPQEGIGYKTKEAEYINAPLKSVVVGDAALLAKWKGLQGRFSDEGDDRYYRPQPGVLPHPRLERYYVEAYDNEYRSQLSRMFRSTYESVRQQAFQSASERAYRTAYNKSYPDSVKQGRDRGYSETYQGVYDANFAEVYKRVYTQNYDVNFAKFKLDAGERARGFKDGNRIASRQKGFDEGFKATYAANIEVEKKKAFDLGVSKATQLYSNNAVIKVTGIELREKDADGIFRPGEPVHVVLKVKNFGLQGKADLNSELLEAQGSISVQQAKVVTGRIPEQSDATVIVPTQATVANGSADGSALQITIRASSGSTNHASQKVTATAQYPSKLTIGGFDGILVPGVDTPVQVTVVNRSKSTQNLTVSVFRDASKVDADKDQLQVSDLGAGQSRQLTLKLRGRMEAKFEESTLELQTRQSDLIFATAVKSTLTIIRKHTVRPESKGLILSANLAQGAGKKLSETADLDTWDLRVDGSLKDKADLEPYKNKVLHILADDHAQIDATSVQVVKQFAAANGSIILWGSRLDYSEVAKALLTSFGAKVSTAVNINGSLTGQEKLAGLSLPVRGIVSIVAPASSKSSVALKSDQGAVATILFGSGTEETVGQTMVAGLNLNDLESDAAKKLLAAFDLVRAPYATKLTNARNNPKAAMHLVAQDILNEMLAAELLGTGEFYKKNDNNNKIARAAKIYIGEDGRKSAQAKELSSYYPAVQGMLGQMPKEQWRAQLVVDKRYGNFLNARNMKDIYCDDHGGSVCNR